MHHSTRKYVQQKCLEANSLNVPMSDGNCTKNQAHLKCLLAKLQPFVKFNMRKYATKWFSHRAVPTEPL